LGWRYPLSSGRGRTRTLPDAFDETLYVAYNDAIFEYFFNQDRAGQPTTLAFDEYAASQIAADLGISGAELTSRLRGMVGHLINPAKQDPYAYWARRSPRLSTALLACSVLIMSRLGSDASGYIQHRGFHERYNLEVLGVEGPDGVPTIRRQDELWQRFAAYLSDDEHGQLGLLTFISLLKYVHLNYPASQCLVRMTDRRRLHGLFNEFLDPANDLDKSIVVQLLNERAAGLTLMLQRAISHLGSDDELSKQMWQIIKGEYEVWRTAPEQIARRTLQRRRGAARDGQYHPGNGAPHLAPNFGRSGSRTDDISSSAGDAPFSIPSRIRSVRPRPSLRIVESRLALVEPYRSAATLQVEFRSGAESDFADFGQPVEEGWVRLMDPIGEGDFCAGFERILGLARLRQYGRTFCAFARSDYGWIETEKLTYHEPMRLVYDADASADIADFVGTSLGSQSIEMADSALRCVSIVLSPAVPVTDLPASISEVLGDSITILRLTSGLRLRNGRYLREGPPDAVFVHPTADSLGVYLDDSHVGTAVRERPFKLTESLDIPGKHLVRIGDRTRSFVIATELEEECEAEGASLDLDTDLGTIVARYPPRLETSLHAEAMKTRELGQLNAVVVVGGDLLLPYSRTVIGS